MPDTAANTLAHELERLIQGTRPQRLGDEDLLRQFVVSQDEDAFAELMRRHASLVLGVAQRIVGHRQDAEDVFQATFLILARKAGSIRRRASLPNFLHGVALRLARKALVTSARRQRREQQAAAALPREECDPTPARELRAWIDGELMRLPESLRLPLILCVLEGQTQQEAAQHLGWLPRTLKARLQRGKERLRQRLERTGMAALPLETLLSKPASASPQLVEATSRLAMLFVRGQAAEAKGSVLALAQVGLAGWGRLRTLLALLLVVGVVGLGGSLLGAKRDASPPQVAAQPEAPATPRVDLHGDPLPAQAITRLGTVRFRHPTWQIVGLAALDNNTLVSVGEDNKIFFWDIQTGKMVRKFPAGDFNVRSFALSPDGKQLAVGGFSFHKGNEPNRGIIRILEAGTGKEVRSFDRKSERMDGGAMVFTPDGKLLASLSLDGIARIEEIVSGAELLREKFPSDVAGQLVVSRDGKHLAMASGPNTRKVFLWDWQSGKPPREIAVPPRGAYSLAFSPDGKILATGDDGNEGVRLWEVATGKLVRTLNVAKEWDILRVRFSPDGRYLAVSSYQEKALVLFDTKTWKVFRRLALGQMSLGLPTFTPDSRFLATTSGEGVLRVLEVSTGKEPATFDAHVQAPSFVHLRDGRAITAGDDGTVRFWDGRTGKQQKLLRVTSHWVRATALSPDGRWLATSELGDDHCVRLWDVARQKQVYRLLGHGRFGGQRAVRFTPDSKTLLSWGDDMYLRRWSVENGKALAELAIRPDGAKLPEETDDREGMKLRGFNPGTFSPDGSLLILGGSTIYGFDTRTGKQKIKIVANEGTQAGMAVSPDGKTLLTSNWGRYQEIKLTDGGIRSTTRERVVCLYDLVTGKRLWRRVVGSKDERERISRVAIRGDGLVYAIGAGSGPARIELGDMKSGKVLHTIPDIPPPVQYLAFSEDGKQLIASLRDTSALIWNVDIDGKK
jgi:RNA polymerase sigma factor (sigma-70 family)